ncbi:MAG: hypothetical protein R3F56_17340 [Planctomycetota bacterium]
MPRLDPTVLDAPLDGLNLAGASLRQQIAAEATLMVFLRHLA